MMLKNLRNAVFTISALAVVLATAPNCEAQWAFGRGFRYRGPMMSVQVGPSYPGVGIGYGAAGAPINSFYGPLSATGPVAHRGLQSTRAELDREAYYYNLDRMHRFQTREERYSNDFAARYTSADAMVNRYRYPSVSGLAVLRPSPQPVPGLGLGRHESRYQGYVSDADVAVALRAAAMRLKFSLTRMADGHVWVRHLAPDQIIGAIDKMSPPSVLADLIINYEGVHENPRLVLISSTEGFQDVRRLLAQYVTMSSTYPNADVTASPDGYPNAYSGAYPGETIISDMPAPMIDEQPMVAPELIGPTWSQSPSLMEKDFETVERPQLDDVPDASDIELLPPPMPDNQSN